MSFVQTYQNVSRKKTRFVKVVVDIEKILTKHKREFHHVIVRVRTQRKRFRHIMMIVNKLFKKRKFILINF